MSCKSVYLLVIIAFCGLKSWAQVPSSWQLTDENGLPSMLVYDVSQDSLGFIWFATEAGLYRYDGVEFKKFVCSTSKANAFGNLKVDGKSRVWCQNFSDQIFYLEHDTLKEFTRHHDYNVKRFTSFGIDRHGLWVLNNSNGVLHNFPLHTQEHLEFKLGISWSSYVGFGNGDESIVLNYNDTIWQFDSLRKEFVVNKYYAFDNQYGSPKKYTHQFYDDNNILFGDYISKDFLIFNEGGCLKGNYPDEYSIQMLCVFRANSNTYWLGTSNGIFVYEKLENSNKLVLTKHIIKGQYVTCIFRDNEHSIWATTLRNGVHLFPNSRVETVVLETENSFSPSISSIGGLGEQIVLATSSGVSFMGNYKHGFKIIPPQSQFEISSIISVKKDFIIFGNYQYQLPEFSLLGRYAVSTVKNVDYFNNKLYFATGLGSVVTNFQNAPELVRQKWASQRCRNLRTRASALDTINGKWYVGYTDGLFVHDISNPKDYEEIKANNESIYARSINIDSKGNVWVGTMGQGLFHLQKEGEVAHLDVSKGLLSNYINDLGQANGCIWIATSEGLQTLNPQTNELINYTIFDGLTSNEVTNLLFINDRVWAATAKSLVTFPMDLNPVNSLAPKIFFGECKFGEDGNEVKNGDQIPYKHEIVTLTFKGLSYKSRGKFRYKYRTIGLDNSWQYLNGNNNKVTLYSLQPGQYQFQVYTINEDGIESHTPATFSFSVEKPFFMSGLFYALLILSFIAITFTVAYVRIRFIRRNTEVEQLKSRVELEKAKLEQELRESQLSSLKSQLNPHFIFNALNSIQEFILLNNTREANRFLGKFADLMRITLELSNSSKCSLEDELKVLRLYLELEGLRFEDSFKYSLKVDSNINPQFVEIPSMLIQPYVENAIKHGLLHKKANRRLSVDFKLDKEKGELIVSIEDNGVGRDVAAAINSQRNKQHRSFATGANQKRLELLNTESKTRIVTSIIDLKDANNKAIGTKVVLYIPIN